MRKTILTMTVTTLLLALFACGNRGKSEADYERMIDSIRKAETARQLLSSVEEKDPCHAYFDTLELVTLPLRYAESFVTYLPQMKEVPAYLKSRFDCEGDTRLLAANLPPTPHYNIVLMAEKMDSLSLPSLYLCVFSPDYVLQDRLNIYETAEGDLNGETGRMKLEYSITSKYEVTLMHFFRSDASTDGTFEWKESRRFHINREGHFEEEIIEM